MPSFTRCFILALFGFLGSCSSVFADSLIGSDSLNYDEEHNIVCDTLLETYWTRGPDSKGIMTWNEAKQWIKELNDKKFGGFNDWRLPWTPDGTWGYDGNANVSKYNVTDSELGHLYYKNLGLLGKLNKDRSENAEFGLGDKKTIFGDLPSGLYWFGTISSKSLIAEKYSVWKFNFGDGMQFLETYDASPAYAIAVRSASPVPEPSSAALFLIGLFTLARIRSRQNH